MRVGQDRRTENLLLLYLIITFYALCGLALNVSYVHRLHIIQQTKILDERRIRVEITILDTTSVDSTILLGLIVLCILLGLIVLYY